MESQLVGIYDSSEAVERRAVALTDYITTLSTTLSTTDTSKYPKYTRRMELELELARAELDNL